jgi:hypothetical protein
MGVTKQSWAIAAGIAVVGILGVAAAQTANPAAPPVEVGAQHEVALSPDQMLVEASNYVSFMDQGATSVRTRLSSARDQRDVVKVLCLNDKLNQIDVAARSARDRIPSLKSAAGRRDLDRARHEYTVVQVLRDRVTQLLQEANQCIGEELQEYGPTKVTMTIDPGIPDIDPSLPPDEPFVSEPPVLSSPTQ